jgi:late competence protein required for DNA uptake (superfamily II DNA/RNA helicase)
LDEEPDRAYDGFVQEALRQQQLSMTMLPFHLLFGLNFPVDRVVLPSTSALLSVSEAQQAAGRAGRTGSASGQVVFASAEQARAVFLGVPLGSECSLERLAAMLEQR